MKLRHNFIALMFGTLLLVPLRTYQLFYAIDPATGFYIRSDAFVPIFTVLLLAIVAFQIVSGFFARVRERHWIDFDGPVIGALSFILASVFIVMSYFSIMPENAVNAGELAPSFMSSFRSLFFAQSRVETLNRTDVLLVIQGLFGMLSGVLFLILGYNCFSNRKIKTPVLLVLTPVIWSCVRLAYSFMGFTSIANLSEHLFDVMMLVFSTLFFYYFAKYVSNIDRDKVIKRLFAFGSPAVIFCFICTIPRYLRLTFGANDGADYIGNPNFFVGHPSLFNLIAPMFFIATLFFILTVRVSSRDLFDDIISDDIGFEFTSPIVINQFDAQQDGVQQDYELDGENQDFSDFDAFNDYDEENNFFDSE